MDFLFQESVISAADMHHLQMQNDARQQCRSLLTLLHMSEHPQAFVKLYLAIKDEARQLQSLADCIEQLNVNGQVQERSASKPTSSGTF